MDINIGLTIDTEAKHKSIVIYDFSEKMKSFFVNRIYGNDIENYTIGLKCIKVPEGYEKFSKQNKPVYVFDKVKKNIYTGEDHKMYKLLIVDIVLAAEEYEKFVYGTDSESLKIIAKRVLETTTNYDLLPKKVKNFNKELFKQDMYYFLSEYL